MALKLLAAIAVLLAPISIPPGIELIRDPTGSSMGIQFILPSLTHAVPFLHDFAPVGAWLIVVYGAVPILLGVAVWSLKRWAWYGLTALGIIVVTWIGTELALFYSFGFTFFYPLIGGMGVAILVLSLLPSVRHAFT